MHWKPEFKVNPSKILKEDLMLSLNDYKRDTMVMVTQKGWLGPSVENIWMYFTEEVGELAGSIRRSKNQFKDRKKFKLESEMGDVFSYLFQLAYMLNIDLDQMWENQREKIKKKRYIVSMKETQNWRTT